MAKGQITVELIIISIAVLVLFAGIFHVINLRNSEIYTTSNFLDAKDMGEKVAWKINEAYVSGFGSTSFIYVRNTTSDGTPLNITVMPSNRLVKVEWETRDRRYYNVPLVTSSIEGGNTTLTQGRLNISNQRGEIQLEQ
ncbi:MAG: hypothetical protein ACQEP1_06475 [Nanobdellota archaeon]